MKKYRARFIKLKVVKLCILDGYLYWKKYWRCFTELFTWKWGKKVMKEFHEGVYGGRHYWKATVNNILGVGFYCPSMFSNVHKKFLLVIVSKSLKAKENYFLYHWNQFLLKLHFNNEVWISLVKSTLLHLDNIDGSLQLQIILLNG